MHELLYRSGEHAFVMLGFGESRLEEGIPSNQYMVQHGDACALLDPGGFGLFPILNARISKFTDPKNVKAIFLSHQDPDVSSGVDIWVEVTHAKVYVSSLWMRFLPHFDLTHPANLQPIGDKGAEVEIAPGFVLQAVPAHFLHSPGQINVYDPISRILFSGDIGASSSQQEAGVFVDDFERWLPHIAPFHRRYMASNKALRRWIREIEKLDIETIAPQHGALYRGEAKEQLIRWLYDLKCGVDDYDE